MAEGNPTPHLKNAYQLAEQHGDGEVVTALLAHAKQYAALQERLEAAEATLRSIDIEQCSPCGGTGERWNPIHGLFDGQCSHCSGTGQVAVLTTLLARAEAAERLNGELAQSNRTLSGLISRFMETDREWQQVAKELTEWGSDSCPNCGSEFIEGCEADYCAYYPLRALLARIESAST